MAGTKALKRKNIHSTLPAATITRGIKIAAAIMSRISGKNKIFLRTSQRRWRTNCLAERSARMGVMFGKVEIYKAKSDEQIM